MSFIGGRWAASAHNETCAKTFFVELQDDLDQSSDEYARSVAFRRRWLVRLSGWIRFPRR